MSLEEKFINSNIFISEWFDGIAESIDLFFVGKKITKKENETNFKVENATYWNEGEEVANATSTGINLKFPNVEQYWNLKFTDYDDKAERRVQQKQALRQQPRQRNYGASVGLIQKLGNVRTTFQPRVSLQDPLDISHSLAFESMAEDKGVQINPKLEFYATPSKGTGTFQALNFSKRLDDIFSLNFTNEYEYEDKIHRLSGSNGLGLGQVLNRKSSLSYGIYFGSNNRPNWHLESYGLSVSWSRLVYKRILDYSITPQLNFSKDNNFTGVPGASLNISLNF